MFKSHLIKGELNADKKRKFGLQHNKIAESCWAIIVTIASIRHDMLLNKNQLLFISLAQTREWLGRFE